MLNNKYNAIDTLDKLKELDAILMNGDIPRYPSLGFDTETNGLVLYKTTVIGYSLSITHMNGYYIPFLVWEVDKDSLKSKKKDGVIKQIYEHGWFRCIWTGEKFDEFVTPDVYNMQQRLPQVWYYLNRWTKDVKLKMHNAPFDVCMTKISCGVDLTEQLAVDSSLLVHILDENEPVALKKVIERPLFRSYLGINPYAHAAMEQRELNESIIKNGGKPGMVWRADYAPLVKYGCADTNFTVGVVDVGLSELHSKFGDAGMDWFFNKEVMPLCKEVVIPMKLNGVYVDVPYFEKIHKEIVQKMYDLEDDVIATLNSKGYLNDFTLGESIDDVVSNKALIERFIKLENLATPTNAKTGKPTLAKKEVTAKYNDDPHWVWGYILGHNDIEYSQGRVDAIKKELYYEKSGKSDSISPIKRHRFNINSDLHLRWLFCTKLKMDAKSLPQTDAANKDKIIPSMKANVLSEFMLPKHPWVQKILSYKKLVKQESTYIRPAIVLNQDGRLYMDMKQNGTTSGRFACSGGYNLQTLPRVADEYETLEECESCGSKDVEVIHVIECMSDMKCKSCGHIKTDIPRPSAIKKGFIAPPGYKIINADYSSLEPRIFAFMSNEPALKDVYFKNLDLYSQVYCTIYDKEGQYSADPKADNYLKKVAPAKRKWIKPVVLGIPYGAQAGQVASMVDAFRDIVDKSTGKMIKIPDIDAGQNVIDQYLGKLDRLKAYMEDCELKAVKLGFVETIFGRRRHLNSAKAINTVLEKYSIEFLDVKLASRRELNNRNASFVNKTGFKVVLPEVALKELTTVLGTDDLNVSQKGNWNYIKSKLKGELDNAKNFPIQGGAGHIANKAMLDVNRSYKARGINGLVILQVHDELTCYVKEEQAEIGAELLQFGMEKNEYTAAIDIPMIAEPVICDNLKDAK